MCNKRNKLNKFILSVMTVSVLCTSIPQSVEAKTSGYEIITSNSEESGGGFFSKLLSFFNIKKFTSKKEDKDISTVEIKEDDSLEEPKKETSTEVDEEVIEEITEEVDKQDDVKDSDVADTNKPSNSINNIAIQGKTSVWTIKLKDDKAIVKTENGKTTVTFSNKEALTFDKFRMNNLLRCSDGSFVFVGSDSSEGNGVIISLTSDLEVESMDTLTIGLYDNVSLGVAVENENGDLIIGGTAYNEVEFLNGFVVNFKKEDLVAGTPVFISAKYGSTPFEDDTYDTSVESIEIVDNKTILVSGPNLNKLKVTRPGYVDSRDTISSYTMKDSWVTLLCDTEEIEVDKGEEDGVEIVEKVTYSLSYNTDIYSYDLFTFNSDFYPVLFPGVEEGNYYVIYGDNGKLRISGFNKEKEIGSINVRHDRYGNLKNYTAYKVLSDGNIAVAGNVLNQDTGEYDAVIMEYDSALSLVGDSIILATLEKRQPVITHIKEDGFNNYVLLGNDLSETVILRPGKEAISDGVDDKEDIKEDIKEDDNVEDNVENVEEDKDTEKPNEEVKDDVNSNQTSNNNSVTPNGSESNTTNSSQSNTSGITNNANTQTSSQALPQTGSVVASDVFVIIGGVIIALGSALLIFKKKKK